MSHGRFDNPVIASLAGFLDLFRPQPLAKNLTNDDRFDARSVVITGANSGLGYAMTKEIARRGGTVIMACRSEIPAAGERARAQSKSSSISMMRLDLSSIPSIHQFVKDLAEKHVQIDVLILNAATTLPSARRTDSGLDEMFLTNYLSNFILVNLLLDKGILVPDARRQPRVIIISSDSHQSASAIDFDEFGTFFHYGVSKAINNYSYFKLLLNTFATELSRRINQDELCLPINIICPGPVNTNIIKEAPWLLRMMLRSIFTLIFKSPDKAALAPVYLAVSNDFDGQTNQYLHMFNRKRMDEKVYDAEQGHRLWEVSLLLWQRIDAQTPRDTRRAATKIP